MMLDKEQAKAAFATLLDIMEAGYNEEGASASSVGCDDFAVVIITCGSKIGQSAAELGVVSAEGISLFLQARDPRLKSGNRGHVDLSHEIAERAAAAQKPTPPSMN